MAITVKGIMSYPTLFNPKQVNNSGDPKYGVNILILKGDPLVATIQAEIQKQISAGLGGVTPQPDKNCLKDCAITNPTVPELAGYMELRCSSSQTNKPTVVDMNLQPIIDPALAYGGAEAFFDVNIAYYTNVSKGVGAYINGVAITGEVGALGRLDSKRSAEQMFAGVVGQAPAATPQAPVAGAPGAPPAAGAQPPAPPAAPAHQMTAAANGLTYEQYQAKGWSDEQLIAAGMMHPPGGVPTAN